MESMASAQRVLAEERVISSEVPRDRRQEILEYLRLFGYKPDRTIIQVHITGFFNRKSGAAAPREAAKREAAAKRYGGTTFAVVGRTHDPAIMRQVAKPRKNAREASPGYVGYLWQDRDPQLRPPHEVIPLDFTPAHVSYPKDWKDVFATKGFLIAMHVPSSFAREKGSLTRALYRLGKNVDVKEPWTFLNELKNFGYRPPHGRSNSALHRDLPAGRETSLAWDSLPSAR